MSELWNDAASVAATARLNVFLQSLDFGYARRATFAAAAELAARGCLPARPQATAGNRSVLDQAASWYGAEVVHPDGSILDRIDDTLADRCACGCRTVLAPDGPSVWYVDDQHQAAHLARQATNPGDVYRRRDAAFTLAGPGADQVDVPLTEPEPGDEQDHTAAIIARYYAAAERYAARWCIDLRSAFRITP